MKSNRVVKGAVLLLLAFLLVPSGSIVAGEVGRVALSASVTADPPMLPPPPPPLIRREAGSRHRGDGKDPRATYTILMKSSKCDGNSLRHNA